MMFKKLVSGMLGKDKEPTNEPLDEEIDEEMEADDGDDEVELDPETLHGTHYSVEDFEREVESRVQAWVTDERADGEDVSDSDIDNARFNLRRDVYSEWTGADSDQIVRWEMANSMAHRGVATSGFVKEDASNPLLAPIHGVSLEDYAAISFKISQGFDEKAVSQALGIDPVILAEANTLWVKRMQEDSSYTVTTLFGQYFGTAANHPKLGGLVPQQSAGGAANLERLRTDRYFYEELSGARIAAYEYGLDGATWIQENYGISLGDFQAVASEYMSDQNRNWSSEDVLKFAEYQEEKKKEYAAKFAALQGGNVADDVQF